MEHKADLSKARSTTATAPLRRRRPRPTRGSTGNKFPVDFLRVPFTAKVLSPSSALYLATADAVASIAIGCVLAGVAAFMSRETMSLLIGEAASAEVVKGVRGLIEAEAAKSGAIRRIHTIRTMHLGPQDVLATVRIDFEDTVSAARVETIVGDLAGC